MTPYSFRVFGGIGTDNQIVRVYKGKMFNTYVSLKPTQWLVTDCYNVYFIMSW